MIKVYVVNGEPRSGKDTFIDFMMLILNDAGVPVSQFSSIDPVRGMLNDLDTVDISGKSPEDRKLLSVVGEALQEHSSFKTGMSFNHISAFSRSIPDEETGVFFLHMREPDLIERMKSGLLPDKSLTTIKVVSKRSESVKNNSSDAGVHDMVYDLIVENNGSRGALFDMAEHVCKQEGE